MSQPSVFVCGCGFVPTHKRTSLNYEFVLQRTIPIVFVFPSSRRTRRNTHTPSECCCILIYNTKRVLILYPSQCLFSFMVRLLEAAEFFSSKTDINIFLFQSKKQKLIKCRDFLPTWNFDILKATQPKSDVPSHNLRRTTYAAVINFNLTLVMVQFQINCKLVTGVLCRCTKKPKRKNGKINLAKVSDAYKFCAGICFASDFCCCCVYSFVVVSLWRS